MDTISLVVPKFIQTIFQIIQRIKGKKIAVNAIIPFCIFFCVTEAVGMNNSNEHSPFSEIQLLLTIWFFEFNFKSHIRSLLGI